MSNHQLQALDRHNDWKDGDVFEEEIKNLLQRAEERLRKVDPVNKQARETTHTIASTQPAEACHLPKMPKLKPGSMAQQYVTSSNGVARADPRRLLDDEQRKLANNIRQVKDPVTMKEQTMKEKCATAGKDWFNLPRTNLTPELRRDLQLLRSRSILDPHRHYKKESVKAAAPEFSQLGNMIEGPTEFFTSRLPNKERKKTFVEEVLAKESATGRFKNKYNDQQSSKTSGRRAFYKKLKESRSRGGRKA